jgi:pyridoxamine 5'-phosphate oxidase
MRTDQIRKEYSEGELLDSQLKANPILSCQLWLNEAIDAGVTDATAFALATVGATNVPSVRFVLLKGIHTKGNSGVFLFASQFDGPKGTQIASNPFVSGAFYWRELERQLRFVGECHQASNQTSDEIFSVRPQASQLAAIASQQSEPIASREELELNYRRAADALKAPYKRPQNWGAFEIVPTQIEFWQGRQNRLHDRILFNWCDASDSWSRQRLQP